jgi:thiol-disulfide isomerase/thioredoxin
VTSGFNRIASVAFCAIALTASPQGQSVYFSRADLQTAIDALDVTDLDGRRWTARDLRGRVVLLDFWATWCAPCLAQIPELQALRQKHAGGGFEILAISINSSTRRDVVAWLKRQQVTWPQVHDGRAFNGPVARAFGLQALPASVLLADGRIVAENLRGERLERAVQALVGRQRISTRSFDAARIPMVMR